MWLDLICGGVVAIMVLITLFIIIRLEMIRKTALAKTSLARYAALAAGIFWLMVFFFFNDGWRGAGFFDQIPIVSVLLLIIPLIAYFRLWLSRQLDKNGRTIHPRIIDLRQWENEQGPDQWYVTYEYLGEYKGKRKVVPTMQVLQAQYAQASETAEEDEGAVAAALPNATVRYLEKHPNIHRFEYLEPAGVRQPGLALTLHEKGFLQMNWKTIVVIAIVAFFLTVALVGLKTWVERNDLIVQADHGWTKTPLVLEAGQCVRLIPSGSVRISEDEGYNSPIPPAGWQTVCTANDAGQCMLNDAPYGALIARFGAGEPFVLEQTIKVAASDSGSFWLAVNDNANRFGDNSGQFRVKYTLVNPPCD